MRSNDIRETFLKYFENYHHQRVKSSSLIPAADPTLLFTNAGMVQFKDAFLGVQLPSYRRATTCQKCVRAGGKHNDLENVGFTVRHHTFFEMLGNFSFGDYFKKEAIAFAWELVTRSYAIPKDRLWITVFQKDDEAFELWKATGVPTNRIIRLGEKDNFWAMGETGPCGPCTEIHYDWGNEHGCQRPDCNPGCACGTRFLEIWNLVFMQFNKDANGTTSALPKPSVDTGAGLERLCSVLQGVYSNYDTDLFRPIIAEVERKTQLRYGQQVDNDISMRVIADHIRAGTFLISDGVTPTNEGRGYVLRRILRRAIRHGKKLGQTKPFLFELVGKVIELLGDVYSDISKNKKIIEVVIREEEDRFHETLDRGMGILEAHIKDAKKSGKNSLAGEVAFKLYDTYGFPLDLITVICKENTLEVDEKGFNSQMEKQRNRSQWERASGAIVEQISKVLANQQIKTSFLGYETLTAEGHLIHLFSEQGSPVDILKVGESGYAVLDKTVFYAESGGQVGDVGTLCSEKGKATVQTTFKVGSTSVHKISVDAGRIEANRLFALQINPSVRQLTAVNHTATHLLHAALRKVLGDRVKQAGSLVEPTRLRFDFTFPRALTREEIARVEALVNEEVSADSEVSVEEMAFEQATQTGALAFFGEKYGDRVRVVRVGKSNEPFSVELCGGTHLSRTSQVGAFKIITESSIASGVRRIEAITGKLAIEHLCSREGLLKDIEQLLGTHGPAAAEKISQLLSENKALKQQNEKLQLQGARLGKETSQSPLWERAITIKDLKVVAEKIPNIDPKLLRSLVDQVRDKIRNRTVVCLGTESEGKAALVVGLSKDLVGQYDASQLVRSIAGKVGGTGGGRGDFAQAGGTKPEGLMEALDDFKNLLK
ncbi:MAG: alanine--tRNA ligase [Deltaproteobacteria bacterium]|nr:alanine--tRNA ligase [Deltaproteobacteria bacterium]